MKASEVLKTLRISRGTLSKYVKQGKIKTRPSVTSWMEYEDESVFSLLNKEVRKVVIYARVSTPEQKNDLANQIDNLKTFCAGRGLRIDGVYSDVASGISFDKRKSFMDLLDEVISGRVKTVVITYKDRLSRVGFDLFSRLFKSFGCKIEIMYDLSNEKTEEQEVFEEIISLLHCYSMKMYSKRKSNSIEISKSKCTE